ncbi:MAG TPA: hypothetical protein HPP77_08750 [Candidatus Hydrogenedentes bacterium]|nr:hypothetical protein [Candidatus Hydrogenedentota bacterium]HIJ72630.1 hypothetical protein [Candidatus Hydrogenedentota bacterium]
MKRIKEGYLLPSAAFPVPRGKVCLYGEVDKPPGAGDLVCGTVTYLGQHVSLENKQGRIHAMHSGTRAVFVLGNRYAPDYYEGHVPDHLPAKLDLLSRSGIVGLVKNKSSLVGDPTQVRVHGYCCDGNGAVLNTRAFNCVRPKKKDKTPNRAKLILNIGTSMNSGKSTTAAACCWALNSMGYTVRGSKVTGTAGLKDILLMEDNGASPVADFTYLGYPSTYLADMADLLHIFNSLDLKYANSPRNFWVVEFADGILQRETAMLLETEEVRSRIHRLIFSAYDAFGAIGGLSILKERFGLFPDAISGICSSSPLGMRELKQYTELPIFNNVQRDLRQMADILI